MKRINTKDELLKELKISRLEELNTPLIQQRFIKLSPSLSSELIKEVIQVVPAIVEAFTETIKCMRDIGCSLEETKRKRWKYYKQPHKEVF